MRRLAQQKAKRQRPKTRSTDTRRHTPTVRPSRKRASNESVQSLMLKMSRERVNQLARDLLDAMTRAHSVTLLKDREAVRQLIAHALADEFKREEEREENVRKKLAAMKHVPAAGSSEWEQIFRKLMEDEYLREGLDT